MSSRRALLSDIVWSLVAIGIVATGVAGFLALGALREPVETAPVSRSVPPVEITALTRWTGPLPLVANGFVQPVRTVDLAADAGGRVVELAPALVERAAVSKGDVLVRLDDRTARTAVQRARADIESTRARLDLNATQLERARTLRQRGVISEDELDRRLAEKAELQGQLASLDSALQSAEIALENTRVIAPFDARVQSREVEVGNVVAAGQPLARVFTPDALEVRLPLDEGVAALIPDLFDQPDGAARVLISFAGKTEEYPARIHRVARVLDARTRTLEVSVRLEGPTLPSALVNAWAEVRIDGAADRPVMAMQAAHLREGDTLWLARQNRLAIVPVEVVHREAERVWVATSASEDASTGRVLDEREALITSILDTPVDGMPIRIIEREDSLDSRSPAQSADESSDESDDPTRQSDASGDAPFAENVR